MYSSALIFNIDLHFGRTIAAQDLCFLDLDLLAIEHNFLGGPGDVGIYLHNTLVTPSTTKLKIV
jgi:hypothetical protein